MWCFEAVSIQEKTKRVAKMNTLPTPTLLSKKLGKVLRTSPSAPSSNGVTIPPDTTNFSCAGHSGRARRGQPPPCFQALTLCKQELHRAQVSLGRSHHQRRPPLLVCHVHISTVGE